MNFVEIGGICIIDLAGMDAPEILYYICRS